MTRSVWKGPFVHPSLLKKIDKLMNNLKISPSKASKYDVNIAKDGVMRSASEILSQKGVNIQKIREIWPEIPLFSREIDDQIQINAPLATV